MPFPKKLLNSNENVLVDLRPHWWFLAEATAAVVGALILTGFALTKDSDALKWICVAVLIVAAVFALQRFVRWSTTNFVITSDRNAEDAPTKRAPKRTRLEVYEVWTGDHWSAAMTDAKKFDTLDKADDYVRANYALISQQR